MAENMSIGQLEMDQSKPIDRSTALCGRFGVQVVACIAHLSSRWQRALVVIWIVGTFLLPSVKPHRRKQPTALLRVVPK